VSDAPLRIMDLGRVPYAEAHALQLRLIGERREGLCPDTLLLCEHEPVITLGRATQEPWLRGSRVPEGVEVYRIERGGEATYHGPGQLVAYPIIDLRERGGDIHAYLRDLETVVIGVLSDLDIAGRRRAGLTGVWVGEAKIAAIGVAVRRWVTFHGVALNVQCALDVFSQIVPCGIPDACTTTVSCVLGKPVSLDEVRPRFADHFAAVFSTL